MTMAFRVHSGNPDALPAAADRAHFVLALQDTFLFTTGIAMAAVACSLLRGANHPSPRA